MIARYLGEPRVKTLERWRKPALGGALAVSLAAGLAIVIASSAADMSSDIAKTEPTGRPCPTVLKLAFAEPLAADHRFVFEHIGYAMRFGGAVCDLVAAKGLMGRTPDSSCQFSAPAELAVHSRRGKFLFEPGIGQKATVIVTGGGEVRCVLASPYWDWDTRTRDAHSRAPAGAVEHS